MSPGFGEIGCGHSGKWTFDYLPRCQKQPRAPDFQHRLTVENLILRYGFQGKKCKRRCAFLSTSISLDSAPLPGCRLTTVGLSVSDAAVWVSRSSYLWSGIGVGGGPGGKRLGTQLLISLVQFAHLSKSHIYRRVNVPGAAVSTGPARLGTRDLARRGLSPHPRGAACFASSLRTGPEVKADDFYGRPPVTGRCLHSPCVFADYMNR